MSVESDDREEVVSRTASLSTDVVEDELLPLCQATPSTQSTLSPPTVNQAPAFQILEPEVSPSNTDNKILNLTNFGVLRNKLMSLVTGPRRGLLNNQPKAAEAYVVNGENTKESKKDYHINCRGNNLEFANIKQLGFKQNNLDHGKSTKNQKRNNTTMLKSPRPQFVTTVKSGEFLEPPPELALLLGLTTRVTSNNTQSSSSGSLNSVDRHKRQVMLYSFSSQPKAIPTKNNLNKQQNMHHIINDNHNNNINNNNTQFKNIVNKLQRTKLESSNKSESGGGNYGNIMFDRRVVRGSTFAAQPLQDKWNPYFGNAKVLSQTCVGESQASRQEEARRRAIARRRAQIRRTKEERYRVGTPPPVKGRLHENVQTEKYLEEIFDRPPVSDIGCQTDLFLDRPESPIYIPAKTGRDEETQIYPGELFDFDIEVAPILEVLVGKTLEQAMIEVLEEDELSALRAQQRRQMDMTAGVKAEQQRMEELEQKLEREKELRLEEHRQALLLQKETEERVAAAMLTHGYLAELIPSVLESLKQDGYLVDDIKADVDQCFVPWLIHEVQRQMEFRVSNQDLLTEIVRDILKAKGDAFVNMDEMELAANTENSLNMNEEEEEEKNVTTSEENEDESESIRGN